MPALQSDPVLLDEAPPSVVSVASSGSIGVRRTRAIKGASEETDESLVQFRLVFLKICTELLETKCEANELLMSLPPKKKLPNYYDRFERPIDLTIIHGNADKWVYSSLKAFDDDIMRMLRNALEFFEAKSEEHVAAQNLQNLYETKKWAEYQALSGVVANKELLREFEPPTTNELELKVEPNEDIIRCICGLFKDEGLMIECAMCEVNTYGPSYDGRVFPVLTDFCFRSGNTQSVPEQTRRLSVTFVNAVRPGKLTWRSRWTNIRTRATSTTCRCYAARCRSDKRTRCMCCATSQ